MIMNAVGEPNIKNQSVDESEYRTYGAGKKVLEWRGRIHGTFRYIFDLVSPHMTKLVNSLRGMPLTLA